MPAGLIPSGLPLPGLGRPLLWQRGHISCRSPQETPHWAAPRRCIGPAGTRFIAGPARNLFPSGRNRPETDGPYQYAGGVESTEAIMFVPILNLVYREFLRSVLSGMATQGARR